MGLLGNKITQAEDKEIVRDDIRMFIKKRNALTTIFNNADKHLEERRRYEKGNQTGKRANERRNVG
jgi:hypothetical protein